MTKNPEAEINRVNISVRDFEEAHGYLAAYDSNLEVVIQRALLTAAIVAYSRPFKKSRGGTDGQSTRSISSLFDASLDENQKSLHSKIIELRDQGVAHSDFDCKPTRRIPSAPKSVMMWSKSFDVLSHEIDIVSFRDLAWIRYHRCIERLSQLQGSSSSNGSLELPDGVSKNRDALEVKEGEITLHIKLQDMNPFN